MRVPDDGEPHFDDLMSLVTAIRCYQALFAQSEEQPSPERQESLREERRAYLTLIARALEEPLMREARRWRNSKAFREVSESLRWDDPVELAIERFARQLFLYVLEALPKLKIDESRNVVALLVIIARRGMSKEEWRVYRVRQQKVGSGEIPPPLRLSAVHEDGSDLDLADERSEEELHHVIERLACIGQLRQLEAFLKSTQLAAVDHVIIEARFITDPPIPYNTIIHNLGAGWTIDAVRQRTKRIRDRLRNYINDPFQTDTDATSP